jgi:hypothetical protein
MTREDIYREALEEIAAPISAMKRRAEAKGEKLDGIVAKALSRDLDYLQSIAMRAFDAADELEAPTALELKHTVARLEREKDELLTRLAQAAQREEELQRQIHALCEANTCLALDNVLLKQRVPDGADETEPTFTRAAVLELVRRALHLTERE